LSVDPLTSSYPWYTPYQFAGNKPTRYIDLDGLEEYDPMQDPFFISRLVITTVYDIKHSIYNVVLASQGSQTRVRYKRDENGKEIFETEFYQRPQPATLQDIGLNTLQDGLDVLNVAGGGKMDASDFLAIRTGGKNQITQALKSLVKDIPSISRKLTTKQDGKIFDFTSEGGKIKFADKNNSSGLYDFVLTEAGELKIGRGHYTLSGEASKVKGAGQININSEGKIDYIDNYSGHYKPDKQELVNQATALRDSGLTADELDVVNLQ